MRKTIRFLFFLILLPACGFFLAACPAETGGMPDTPPPPPAPALTGDPDVTYSPVDGAVSVRFTFDMNVSVTPPDGWDLAGDGTPVITASPSSPLAPGAPVTLRLTAANKDHPERAAPAEAGVMPVGGVFARPGTETVYTLAYYDARGAAGLVSETGTSWLYVAGEYFQKLFGAVYLPNGPGTGGLFRITLGAAPASGNDKIEIAGENLPAGPAVINIGLPEGNSGLPPFFIPDRGLGVPGGEYPHLRIRVNRGASLVILADNTGYEEGGAGNPCPEGYFAKGTAEVMGGGSLRDGAYEGFPLGAGSVIIARLGSRLAAGPETSFDPDGTGYAESRDQYFSGWLIGPDGTGKDKPRIAWGTGDQNGDYIEIREGRLAFSANVTVRKTLALDCSVWFVNGPALTIDAAGDSLAIAGRKGLFARAGSHKFYGTASSSGGQNPGSPAAEILLKAGSAVQRSFLAGGTAEGFTGAEGSSDIRISCRGYTEGGPGLVFYAEGNTPNIFGYLNWTLPSP